jgi:hypothetical protein
MGRPVLCPPRIDRHAADRVFSASHRHGADVMAMRVGLVIEIHRYVFGPSSQHKTPQAFCAFA